MVPVFADVDLDTFNLDPQAARGRHHAAHARRDPGPLRRSTGRHGCDHGHRRQTQAAGHRGRRPRARRELQKPPRGQPGAAGIVLVPIEQEPDLRRGGHHHHERSATGRLLPLAAQLRSHPEWRVVRAPCYFRQLPARRIARGLAQRAVRAARRSDPVSRRQRTVPPRAAHELARPASATAPRILHPARLPPLYVAYRRPCVRRARAAVIAALCAEGVPCSAGYGFSLPEQPMFRNRAFGPYLPGIADRLDYQQVHCPNSDLLCREQALWLEQSMFLGPREDMDDIYRAFEKVHDHRAALADWSRREGKG